VVADGFAAGLQLARELVLKLLASRIARDRPNSITVSSLVEARYQVADQLMSWFASWIV